MRKKNKKYIVKFKIKLTILIRIFKAPVELFYQIRQKNLFKVNLNIRRSTFSDSIPNQNRKTDHIMIATQKFMNSEEIQVHNMSA